MANEEGYSKIAALMSCHGEFAIFRRFKKLNFQNLLYLQAELTHLEADLKEVAVRDQADPNRAIYSKHWWYLAQSEEDHDDREQWEKVIQIREKLKEYNEHLQQVVFLSSLQAPKSYDLNFIRQWLKRPKMGNFPILGPDHDSWSTPHADDLLAIRRRESSDPLSRWVINLFIPWFHNIIGKRFKKPIPEDPPSEITHYAEAPLHSSINIFVTVLASLIPISSIIILYFVSNILDRLAITVGFTGLFAFCLALTTRARRAEIFAATSTFAAVCVVFITGNNGYIT
ncbi:hypothetical protein OIDMADRAFT_183557 [Oidiodendron maius Zn]|uniref:DUF6594 domain-containing protein n=1 Tax=Oidiodendron maius (strain Zn) TaxID=913774 RepID=A0A0C3D2L9_OIDMZ|nr:hypothetical protein OIDMADRAFT_183557 [Oidiodendron maius Zn]